MRVIIVGCGRLGAHLARRLDRENHEVVVIDRNAESFARLGSEFRGRMVFGTGIDEDILRRAGIERADAFIGVVVFGRACGVVVELLAQQRAVVGRGHGPSELAVDRSWPPTVFFTGS